MDNLNQNDQTHTHFALTKGMTVGHYKIIEKIGAGGMGEVYLAEDTQLNRKVALKFLPLHLCQDKECRARFKREAQAAAKLDHPNIVTIYEVSEHYGRPFFAMQHVGGPSLGDFVQGKELSISKIADLAIQICEGLSQAHHKGVLHRDIKPSNIVIDVEGRPKLLDFGLATVPGGEHLTKTGSTLGTVRYMSPEQAQGQEVDHRSDLFSFGIVLYEMITGRTPFVRQNDVATAQAIVSATPEPLSKHRASISDDFQRIVSKLLEKDPQLRYQSAADVVSDLKRLVRPSGIQPAPALAKRRTAKFLVAGLIVLLGVIGVFSVSKLLFPGKEEPSAGKKMLVVLPFQNLGSPGDDYFADGITDEITSKLCVIQSLGVISRTSAMQYKKTDKGLPQIAKELGVDYVLEGTIRWDKSGDTNLVRITPQLIKASDNTHIWAGNYERPLKGVFAVQADIATQIVNALDVTLLQSEQQMLDRKPTENVEAYGYYLRAVEYNRQYDVDRAIRMLNKAVEIDKDFCRAYAMLVQMRGYGFINNIDRSKESLEAARQAADRAFELAEGKPDGYLAKGYFFYYFAYDYDRALEYFEKALHAQPNNSDLLAAIGFVKRRQGKWDEALVSMSQALKLDPLSTTIAQNLALTYLRMHRLKETEQVVDNGLTFTPDDPLLLIFRAFLTLYLEGDTRALHADIEKLNRYAPRSFTALWQETMDIFLRHYDSALARCPHVEYYQDDTAGFYNGRGNIYRLMGSDSLSRIYYDSARAVCEKQLQTQPDNAKVYEQLAVAHSGLGQKDDAVQCAKRATELMPLSKDALEGADAIQNLAIVYCMVGEYESAIDQLEILLTIPSMMQVAVLCLHPGLDPLRDHPRFQALLKKYGNEKNN